MTIDRAIEILDPRTFPDVSGDEAAEACRMGMEALKRQRWIPCSERLPKSGTECNVVWVNHNPEPYYAAIKDVPGVGVAIYYKGEWYWWSSTCEDILAEYGRNDFDKIDDCIQITHWMPLPEPPEEEHNAAKETT